MPKIIMTLLLVLALAGLAWSQEEPPGSEADEPQLAATEAADEADEIDDSDLDEQTYEEDEDDFVPTEEIPADVPIPFPSNI